MSTSGLVVGCTVVVSSAFVVVVYGLKELFIVALVGCFYYMVSIVLSGNPECLSC